MTAVEKIQITVQAATGRRIDREREHTGETRAAWVKRQIMQELSRRGSLLSPEKAK